MTTQYTIPAGRYSDTSAAFIQAYIDQSIAGVIDLAPETLNSLNELAAAINDDPAFFSTMAAANTTLQTNIDNLSTAATTARTNLQTLLQAAVDAVQADVDANETTSASAVAAEASARGTAITNLQTTLQGLIDAVQADVDQNESDSDAADTALSNRLDTLEADPTTATALAAVQADVDQNETDSDAADAALSTRIAVLEADPTTATAVAAVQADVDQNETDADAAIAVERGRIDAILASADANSDTFAEIVTLINSVDTENDNAFAGYVTSNNAAVAAVQADVDQNESDSDAADTALSGRLDVLEADPTTATAVAAVQADVDANETASDAAEAALSGRLDVLEADPTTATAVAAVQSDVDANEVSRKDVIELSSNITQVKNSVRSTRIDIGNNIALYPQSGVGRVEVEGALVIDLSAVENAADDTAAAAAGVIVGGVYHNNGALRIRLS